MYMQCVLCAVGCHSSALQHERPMCNSGLTHVIFVVDKVGPGMGISRDTFCLPINIILPVLYMLLHLYVALTRMRGKV
jgi:hypothetical protein